MGIEIVSYVEEIYNNLDDLIFSFLVIVIAVFLCDILRELLLYGNKLDLGPTMRYAVAETLGTLECTVIAFEINMIIHDVFGVYMYVLFAFIALYWQSSRTQSEYEFDANPLVLVDKHLAARRWQKEVLHGKISFILTLLISELIGAFLAYTYIMYGAWNNAHYWTMWKKTNYHITKYESADNWQSNILRSNAWTAAVFEGFFSCAQYLLPVYVASRNVDFQTARVMVSLGKAIFAGIGCNYSGAYYNPVIALALEITTTGSSYITEAIVYWGAPLLGTLVGISIDRIS